MDLWQGCPHHGLLAEDLKGGVPEEPLQAMACDRSVRWPYGVRMPEDTDNVKEAKGPEEV